MPRMGRPTIEIDWKQFETLCSFQCTEEDIARFFGCSVDTIGRHVKKHYGETFAEVYKKKCVLGLVSLRRKMFYLALEKGNVTMCIFLSKQHLGYSDKVEHSPSRDSKEGEIVYKAKWGTSIDKPEDA